MMHDLMSRILPSVFTLSFATGLLVTLGAAEARNDPMLDLPTAVKTTIQKESIGHNIAAIERDQRDGRMVYRVRIAQEGIDKRLVIASDGTLLEVSDYPAVNNALTGGKAAGKEAWEKTKDVSGEAWDATKDVASRTWEATKETVGKATRAFKSDDLTLNQVPRAPRTTMEREAEGNRLTDIRTTTENQIIFYHVTIDYPDGTKRPLVVQEDGTLVTSP